MTGVEIVSWILGPLLMLMTVLFIFRIILSWYPQLDLTRFPFVLVALPTEPFGAAASVGATTGRVDITPIVWIGLFSLVRELLLGQQGLLTMLM